MRTLRFPLGLFGAVTCALLCSQCATSSKQQSNGLAEETSAPESAPKTITAETWALRYWAEDEAQAMVMAARLREGVQQVESFFAQPFPKRFEVVLFPDRERMTQHWREAWGAPDFEPACWMVASGTATTMTVLSPRVWAEQACEHDPQDTARVQALLTHELVHVYHGQHSPRPDFDGLDAVGWFVEGLAVLASGQLALHQKGRAQEALVAGQAPKALATAWSGKYRYGVCGSLVKYVDSVEGRSAVVEMLAFTTEEQFLSRLGMTEQQLLSQWAHFVSTDGS